MTESSCSFQKCNEKQHVDCLEFFAQFGLIIIYYLHPLIEIWWTQGVIRAACHCYSWWRCSFDNLWVSLVRLWWHSLSYYLQIDIVEISLQFHRYKYLQLWLSVTVMRTTKIGSWSCKGIHPIVMYWGWGNDYCRSVAVADMLMVESLGGWQLQENTKLLVKFRDNIFAILNG